MLQRRTTFEAVPNADLPRSDTMRSEILGMGPRAIRDIEPFERLENCVIATAGNCMITAWSGALRAQELLVVTSCAQSLAKAYPRGIALIVVLPSNLALPNADERARMAEFYRNQGTALRAVAFVVLGDGFWASAVRGVLTAMQAVNTRTYATHVSSSAKQAAAWIGEVKGFMLSEPAGTAQVIERLESTFRTPMSYRPPAPGKPPQAR